MRKGMIMHADAVHVRRSRSERHARKQGFACQALIIRVQRNARREPCSLRTLTPMLWLATTSIDRRGTISTTRRHRTAARAPPPKHPNMVLAHSEWCTGDARRESCPPNMHPRPDTAAANSIARRGTISAKWRIIAATRLYKWAFVRSMTPQQPHIGNGVGPNATDDTEVPQQTTCHTAQTSM